MSPLRILVLDAYTPEGRAGLRAAGGTEAGLLYRRMLASEQNEIEVEVEIAYPADPHPDLPAAAELADFDGLAWTGSSLTIHHADDPRVARQIALAKLAYRQGVPSFGSCWAAQLAVVAAGGRCATNPKGREFGIARDISLCDAGRAHPLFAGKPTRFCGFTSHEDEVTVLADGVSLLASNTWSRVQAVSVEHGAGQFWAVQYHPEYDLHEVASLCRLRSKELVGQGRFDDDAEARRYIDDLETLHEDPTRNDLASALEIASDLLDPRLRMIEARNWLASLQQGSV
jgi:GMP synthase (glutamine-hydrolysing)